MIIELLSIGDELLKGTVVNTNAAFIARHLRQNGYAVAKQTTLPDHREALLAGFKEALARADLVIATGGLGPTLDDHTRRVAASLFHSDFHFDSAIADDLTRRFGSAVSWIEDQATVPTKAQVWPNRVGTAPGFLFLENKKALVLLQGVPREMEPMFLEQVLPFIQKQWPLKGKKHIELLHFCLVYESLLDPHLRRLSERYPAVEAGIYPAHGTLSVSLLSADAEQLESFKRDLLTHFNIYHFLSSNGKIAEALQHWFVTHRKSLAIAESCTGGMLSAQVTAVSGSSNYFLGSFVSYSNAMKENSLGVPHAVLQSQGAVSEATVRAMLEGVFHKTSADFGIAVSGIAGPLGGTEEKPVGTIWAAIGERGKTPDVGRFQAKGNRETIILSTSNYLLGVLWRKVEKGIPVFPFIV